MLAARAEAQRERTPGYTRMLRKPRGHLGPWDPTGEKIDVDVMSNRALRRFWRAKSEPKSLEQWVTSNLTALRLMAASAVPA